MSCFRWWSTCCVSGSSVWCQCLSRGGLSFFFALLVGINMSIPVSMWCLSACHVVSTSPRPGIFSSWLKFWMWSLRPSHAVSSLVQPDISWLLVVAYCHLRRVLCRLFTFSLNWTYRISFPVIQTFNSSRQINYPRFWFQQFGVLSEIRTSMHALQTPCECLLSYFNCCRAKRNSTVFLRKNVGDKFSG